MRLSEVEKKARNAGVKDTWKYSKKELIKAIQCQEGNNQCFNTVKVKAGCPELVCCWREDCLR
ncbi:MAG: SAP domain-containing protein [Candidatus Omnitrophota bacterium]